MESRVDGHALWGAVEIAGGLVPLATLAAIHRELERVSVRPADHLVALKYGLDSVGPGRKLAEALERISEDPAVDHGLMARPQGVDVDAEGLLGLRAVEHLVSRFVLFVRGDDQDQPAVDGPIGERTGEAHVEAEKHRPIRPRRGRDDGDDAQCEHAATGRHGFARSCFRVRQSPF